VDTKTWQGKKSEAIVNVPEQLDLRSLRAKGLQEGEELLPEVAAEEKEEGKAGEGGKEGGKEGGVVPDQMMAVQMESMGFSANAIARALLAVGNAGVEQATAWLFEHLDDANINDPLPSSLPPSSSSSKPKVGPDAAEVSNLAAMLGFTEEQAKAALTATDGNMERAADWLFSHADDLAGAVAEVLGVGGEEEGGKEGGQGVEYSDGEGVYRLVGFISHVGRNLGSGHYVAHIEKEGRWAIFDDQKVAASEKPPRDLGYLYVYRREDAMNV